MVIKPQAPDSAERVTLRVPADVWTDVCHYAELLGPNTTPQYVCVEAIKAVARSREYRQLVQQAAAVPAEPALPAVRRPRRPDPETRAEAVA